MAKEAKHPVETSRKTIRILNALREQSGGRVTDIAEAVGMNKSTVHNHLSTLEEEEIVTRDGPLYKLSLRMLEFGGYIQRSHEFYKIAEPELERLANQTGELVNIMVEEYGQGVYLACRKGSQAVDVNIYPGLRSSLHLTGSGKAILANLPPEQVEEIIDQEGLPAKTPHSITDQAALKSQLETIREQGFATDDEEFITGLRCIGAPILDGDGAVVGAISISQPITRADSSTFMDEASNQVQSAANVIELNMNH